MKLVELKITNFRGYQQETAITFEELTILIGKNDAGKSTILDALNIFFNDEAIEKDDACVFSGLTEIKIACVFKDLPPSIVLDEQFNTSLHDAYLVRDDGQLEIERVYSCAAAKPKQTGIFAIANHPSTSGVSDLLTLKQKELKARAKERSVDLSKINQTINAQIRSEIWKQTPGLTLAKSNVDLDSESGT